MIVDPALFAGLSDDDLLRLIGEATVEATGLDGRLADLFEYRLLLYVEGRARKPPLVIGRMAEAAGLSVEAVSQAIHKDKRLMRAHRAGSHVEPLVACRGCRAAPRVSASA